MPVCERKMTMNTLVPSFEFRRRARMAMKPMMSVLIVVALIAALPTLISSTTITLTGATTDAIIETYSNRFMQIAEKYGITETSPVVQKDFNPLALAADLTAWNDDFNKDMLTFVREKGPILLGLTVMEILIVPVLTLGLINAALHALRKQEFTAAIALSRFGYILRILGLELLQGLLLFLWLLPGLAVILLSRVVPESIASFTMITGMVLMLVLGIRAWYRYAMSECIMADDPTTPIRACIRRSCEVMKTRKLELFSLELSFIGWELLLMYARGLLEGLLGPVLGMALGLFAALFLTLYTTCAKAAFYQEYAVGPIPAPEQEATA